MHVRASSQRAFGESMLLTLSEQNGDRPREVSQAHEAIARARLATMEADRFSAGDMVDAAVERARRAASEARTGADAADALALTWLLHAANGGGVVDKVERPRAWSGVA